MSVLDTFRANFAQVAEPILAMARESKRKPEEMQEFLGLLEGDQDDVEKGKPIPSITEHIWNWEFKEWLNTDITLN